MNIQLNVDPPKFQVGDWVYLHHPLYNEKTPGMITQIRCLVTIFTVKMPPEFRATETRYDYFLHISATTFFAEADLEKSVRDLNEEIESENEGL